LRKSRLKSLLEYLSGLESRWAARWASSSHHRLFRAQWAISPNPEWFDHDLDRFWQWSSTGNSLWVERGAFSSIALKPNGRVLELACGDGFNTKHFYAHRAAEVIAVDFDVDAIKTARRKNAAGNITYLLADIRDGLPPGPFENICWDAAMEHFTEIEIAAIMSNIKSSLTKDGILTGYSIVERDDGHKHLEHHEYEFKSMQDLKRFLDPCFSNVLVFETIFPTRHNLYFYASDGPVPFTQHWMGSVLPQQ
jgi:SAM-dependent methyltransferase